MHAPAPGRQALLAFAVDVALVGLDITAGVARVEHLLEVQGVVLAGRADVHAADQLVASAHAARELEAEGSLAILLRPARLYILLPALRGRPLGRHRVLLDDLLLVLVQRLLENRHDAGIDHLSAARDVALAVELPAHGLEDPLSRLRLDQPLLERPDGRAVGCLRTLPQPHEALEAQPVQKLELHLLVAEVVELLDHQHPHHQLGRKRWPSATLAARSGRCLVDLRSQRRKVHVRGQFAQRVADLVQLRLTLLLREQTDLDHHHFLMPSTQATSCQGRGGFSRCPTFVLLNQSITHMHHTCAAKDLQSPSNLIILGTTFACNCLSCQVDQYN